MSDTTDPIHVDSPPKPERVTGLLMFISSAVNDRHWVRVDDLPNQGEKFPTAGRSHWSFDTDLFSGARPGMIYEFEFTPDYRQVFYHKKRGGRHVSYDGLWKNAEDCAIWRAAYAAAMADADAVKSMNKDARWRPDLETLEPFRKAYVKLLGARRGQLIAQVVRYITSGKAGADE